MAALGAGKTGPEDLASAPVECGLGVCAERSRYATRRPLRARLRDDLARYSSTGTDDLEVPPSGRVAIIARTQAG